jgi:hypothetical protein
MSRILLLGLDPETVDFSDPALPPGMTAEKVRAGIAVALKQFADRGWESDVGFIRPDETAGRQRRCCRQRVGAWKPSCIVRNKTNYPWKVNSVHEERRHATGDNRPPRQSIR